MALTYRDAGVDIEEGDRLVELIKPYARSTLRPEVLAGIGGFGGLFALDLARWRQPVLVSGTDGVGTKLKIAFLARRHDTVGIDLVAMCVNDVAVVGAEPLFFLDYYATGKLSADEAALVVKGIAEGCQRAGCALIGGETAELPGFYQPAPASSTAARWHPATSSSGWPRAASTPTATRWPGGPCSIGTRSTTGPTASAAAPWPTCSSSPPASTPRTCWRCWSRCR
jgi:hypothetical protein